MSDLYEQIQGVLKGSGPKQALAPPVVSGKAQSLPTGLPKQVVQTAAARPPGVTFEEAKAMSEGFGQLY